MLEKQRKKQKSFAKYCNKFFLIKQKMIYTKNCWKKSTENTVPLLHAATNSATTLSMIFFFKLLQNHTLYPLVKVHRASYCQRFMFTKLTYSVMFIELSVVRLGDQITVLQTCGHVSAMKNIINSNK